eukprot:CAMPEP_0175702060 /NCGR_PEP_ID=MMETSP0097-20121207/35810_1 /TAXON_ID=311494 /ORGANISM="Alexandrium monilatum, Strain CCMP3105" /LENGTH=65 /DNA_ID=CAMNT_0017009313 /DNA_START=30 /DNA_END=224 /DNA_ORIENTATION=-
MPLLLAEGQAEGDDITEQRADLDRQVLELLQRPCDLVALSLDGVIHQLPLCHLLHRSGLNTGASW